MTLSDVQMADHDVKINMLETSSHDGTFVWKIDDFGRRYQEAVAGRVPSIYSPQFYVGHYHINDSPLLAKTSRLNLSL